MSNKRRAILDSALQLMLDEGYAAVTYRGVAARAEVTPGLVQYYFPSLDELFIALLRENTDRIVERLAETSAADQPLRAVWEYASDRTGTALLMEFMALANHRKAIAPVIGEGGERVRQAQLAAISSAWDRYALGDMISPAALLFLMSSVPRMIRLEEGFGTSTGHAETIALVEEFLDRVEPRP
jgi:AcrR family transcriptional regulator